MVNGQVKVCFLEAQEGQPQQAILFFVDENGGVLYQSDTVDIQPGWCLGFGTVCSECDLEATMSYEAAGEQPKGKAKGPAAATTARPSGGQAGKPGPHGK